MDIRFDCTQCGKCCHDLRLPLSVDEAIVWAGRGHAVQLLCDAQPILSETPPDEMVARYRYERSFPARSGDLAVRVNVILVATHAGPCPHLRPDMLCGNYEERPRVCRIYPAEIVPEVALDPNNKGCPPEAWADEQPVYLRGGAVVQDETRRLIEEHRAVTHDDVPVKAAACALLGISRAALQNEGYAVHAPSPATLVAALQAARLAQTDADPAPAWSIATNRQPTMQMLRDADAEPSLCNAGADYLGFFPDLPSQGDE